MILPPALRPNSCIQVVAPSGPFDRALVLRGIGWLGERYRVRFRPDLFARQGFLAGSDERRLEELTTALCDPDVDAIATARGGHGLMRIIHALPLANLRAEPKWLVGFSDPTALHLELSRIGVASLHASNVAGLGRADAVCRSEWLQALEHPTVPRSYHGVAWSSGKVRGPLVGGNLTLLAMMAVAGRLHLPDGCILAIEDVSESSYRVDRMLSALTLGGHFDRVAGFAIGEFTECSSGPFRVEVKNVLRENLPLGRPTVAGLEFGHGSTNRPLTLGALAQLDADGGCLVTPA